MKILFVCSNSRVFGAETVTLSLMERLQERGHELLAVTSPHTDGLFARRLATLGIREVVMPFGAVAIRPSFLAVQWTAWTVGRMPRLWWLWRKTLRGFQPEVVVWTASRQAMLLLPVWSRLPSLVIEHTNLRRSRGTLWLYKVLVGKVNRFVAVSEFMRDHLGNLGVPAEKISVIRNGMFSASDKGVLSEVGTRLPLFSDLLPRIGVVGQIAPNKGYDCLIQAVRMLADRGIEVTLTVFGTGDPKYVHALSENIERYGLAAHWKWMGYEEDKGKIFSSMDICVVPSCFGDPFPTVAMEAGAYGIPVVASRVGGLPEIIDHGRTGWLVEPNNPLELAGKLEWLIRNPGRAREMGVAGRVRVFEHFTIEKSVAEFEALLHVATTTHATREKHAHA